MPKHENTNVQDAIEAYSEEFAALLTRIAEDDLLLNGNSVGTVLSRIEELAQEAAEEHFEMESGTRTRDSTFDASDDDSLSSELASDSSSDDSEDRDDDLEALDETFSFPN